MGENANYIPNSNEKFENNEKQQKQVYYSKGAQGKNFI